MFTIIQYPCWIFANALEAQYSQLAPAQYYKVGCDVDIQGKLLVFYDNECLHGKGVQFWIFLQQKPLSTRLGWLYGPNDVIMSCQKPTRWR